MCHKLNLYPRVYWGSYILSELYVGTFVAHMHTDLTCSWILSILTAE